MSKENTKSYIGDGVYVDIERGMIKLTTENEISIQNTVFLELEVFEALVLYFNKMVKIGSELKWVRTEDSE